MAKVNGKRPIYKLMIDKNLFHNDLCDDCEACDGYIECSACENGEVD